MSAPGLHAKVDRVEDLQEWQRDGMFALMKKYFEGVDRSIFEKDLSEKKWVVSLSDPLTKTVYGFSTLMLMEDTVQNIRIRSFYSGDTVMDRSCWNLFSLERAWVPFVFSRVQAEPDVKWFWFLVCKGYRTYRYLPVYFYRYLPSKERALSFDVAVLRALAERKFGQSFDSDSGIIQYPNDYRLRGGVGDITPREMRDPAITFFAEKNPDWRSGAELACLAELNLGNVKPIVRRLLRRRDIP